MSSSLELNPGADPLIGQTLGGKYTIDELIGRGGMGHVYSATSTEGGATRDLVVKMIAPPLAQQPQAMARFEREAKRLDGLRHSNIVEMYDYGREGGRAYIVMEFVDGELLSDFMARKGRLTLAEFVPIAAQILKGVGHAHSRDLMVRDIKPANVMLCERKGRANFVKIIDFGLAKMLEGDEDITKQHFIGTSGYLSPEQIKGLEIDLRVDVYALGVLFYQMLSGRMPFEAENDTTLLYKHVHEFPTPLSEVLPDDHEVPDELVHLLHDCLEKDPDQRPRDANEIVEKLIDCVPMAMFKLPAVTEAAEETAISALATAALNAPTGETAAYMKVEDASASVSASAQGAALSRSGPQVAISPSQSFPAEPEQAKPKLGLMIGGGAALVAVLGIGAFFLFGGDKDEPEVAVAGTDNHAELEAAVAAASELVASGDFDGADTKLDLVRGQLADAPALAGTVGRLDKQIEVGRRMATAKKLDDEGRTGAAISAYEAVLEVDASNAEARTRIAELQASVERGNGLIEISSEPAADLMIDGSPAGNTPYGKALPLGKHTLVLSAKGYESRELEIDVKAGDNNPIDIRLTPLEQEDEAPKPVTKKKPAAQPVEAEPEPEPEPKPEKDNPFLPTKKKKQNGPFLPTEK
ncbi:serine/threonine-protein kinase [Enhygromyxa salina]|nr:serine/threonine-protein kinase [Enhygromyxa salina]